MDNEASLTWFVVISHGGFSRELVNSCEMILGKIDNVYCFSLEPGMAPEQLVEEVTRQITDVPNDIIIFTDIYAGTPSNVAAIFAKRHGYPVICGMNLPMLIEAEMQRGELPLVELVERIIEVGNGSIKNITTLINGAEYE
jgi:D-glucosaminate-specific PTS system IIA component